MTPSVKIKKSTVPILWIDTSIIINMTLLRLGTKLDSTQKKRIEFLYQAIKEATRKGKLICPLADQDEEIWVERKEFLNTIHELSLGISTDSTISVQKKLFKRFAEAYITLEKNIELDYSVLFHEDPLRKIKHVLSSPVYVTINPPLIGGPEKTKSKKRVTLKRLNEIREENITNKVALKTQKEAEFMAEFNFLKTISTAPHELAILGLDKQDYFWNRIGVVEKLKTWSDIVSEYNKHDTSILSFFLSTYYRQIPSNKIRVELFAKLMTDKQPIRSGDMQDVKHISSMLPFVDMFITDKQRKVQLHKLSFNEEYKTKVCYVGDSKDIEEFFDSL